MTLAHRLRAWSRAFVSVGVGTFLAGTVLAQSTVTYTYDELGRVVQATDSPSGRKVIYTYDAAGNRTQVGNGVAYSELTPTAFTASTTQSGAGGISPVGGMKDSVFNTRASIHVTQSEATPWVQADLGSAQAVDHIDIAPAKDAAWAIDIWNLNTAQVQYSVNGTTWTTVATIAGAVQGNYITIRLGGVSARYIRLKRPTAGQFAIGDFRLFTSDDTTNVPPVATNDTATANGGVAVNIDVLANDTDQENSPLSVSAYTQPANGTVSQNGSLLVYTPPNSTYAGTANFTYTVSDSDGANATGAVAVTVLAAANAAPSASNDSVSTPAYMRTTFDPRANDSDPDSNPLTITGVGAASHGTVTVNNGTSVTYVPATAYVGTDAFLYTISDGKGGTASATVNMTMTSGNPAMLAVMEPATYAQHVTITGETFNIPSNQAVNVYINEPIVSGKVYWEVEHQCGIIFPGLANNVTTARVWGGYSTSYNAGFDSWNGALWPSGTPSSIGASTANDVYGFAYNASTHELKIYRNNVYKASLTTSSGPQYPHASMQSGYAIPTGQACGDTSAQGKFKFGAGATTYAPPAGYSHLSDHSSTGNQSPTAANDTKSTTQNTATTFDPRTNDSDPDGGTLSVTSVGTPTNGGGTAAVSGGGTTITFTPANNFTGSTSFSYTITDGQGGSASGTVNVTVTPAGQQGRIVLRVDDAYELYVNGVQVLSGSGWSDVDSVDINLQAGDVVALHGIDTGGLAGVFVDILMPNGQRHASSSAWKVSTTNTSGWANTAFNDSGWPAASQYGAVNSGNPWYNDTSPQLPTDSTGQWIWSSNNDTHNDVYLRFVVPGGGGGNQSPSAVNDTKVAQKNTALSFDPRTNDSDPDGGALSVTAVGAPTNSGGSTVITGGGTGVTYTPANNFTGATSFSYTLSDGQGGSAQATVSVTVNAPPVAATDTKTTAQNTALPFDPRTNDSDPDGGALSVTAVGTPTNSGGSTVITGGGTGVTYTPANNFTGSTSFSYTLSDGQGGTASGTVNVTVSAGGGSSVTWDPSNKSSNIALSNGNLTGTHNSPASDTVARATASVPSGAKRYYEVTYGATSVFGYGGAGVCNASQGLNTSPAYGNGLVVDDTDGTIYGNGSWLGNIGSLSSGVVVGFAIDDAQRKVWIHKNGTYSGNPTTGVGGFSYSYISGAVFPCLSMYEANDARTGNFGGSSFAYTPPSGFSGF
jgi:YD repeat-containing protein